MVSNNKGIENCWEFWDCPVEVRDECLAYNTKSGRDCFNFTSDFSPKLKSTFEHCWECPWYKKLSQDSNKRESDKYSLKGHYSEKRACGRTPVAPKVMICFDDIFYDALILNVSRNGIYFSSNARLSPGLNIEISIPLKKTELKADDLIWQSSALHPNTTYR